MRSLRISVLIRLAIFLVIAGLFAVMEINTLTGPHTGTTHTYYAIFGNTVANGVPNYDGVSGLHDGNPVKVAGVAVGKVQSVDLLDASHAKVTFTANEDQAITTHTWAIVRYANLLGQRYLALTQSGTRAGTPLKPGSTIPATRTAPALSLTALFNGFRPLFSALTPNQVNELSQDIIDVLQGQTDRLDALISQTADLTANLADRDQTFTQVLDSLSTLLGTVAKHDNELAGIVTTVQGLTQQLHEDGPAILGSLGAVDQLTGSVAGLLGNLQDHNLPGDIDDAASITGALAQNTTRLKALINGFVSAFGTFARVSQNGNYVNIYPCAAHVKTFGTVTITGKQGIDALLALLNSPTGKGVAGNLGTSVGGLLDDLGLGALLGGTVVPVPLNLPNGDVGAQTGNTAVCR